LFLDHRRQDLKRMQEAIEQGDFDAIRIMGHRIKGLAGSYGFHDIGLAGAQLEQAAREQDIAAMRRTIDRLTTLLTQARQAV
ncbi:MAG: Hpt domain-containing protein, partial [Nitrospira sp.]